jgi:hypothetical protein
MKYTITYRNEASLLRTETVMMSTPDMAIALALSNEQSDEYLVNVADDQGVVLYGRTLVEDEKGNV